MNTKLRFVLTLIGIIVVVAGFIKIFGDKNPTSTETQEKQIVSPPPTETADLTPQRALKPNEEFIAQANLYIQVPDGMSFRQEIADDPARLIAVGFYIESTSEDENYTLYGLFQNKDATEQALEQAQKEMDPDTIKEASVGGYKGVEGLVTGQKTRYSTLVIKDGKLISFSTIPPTEKNMEITEQILSTVSFE
jgi:hypothetical protein